MPDDRLQTPRERMRPLANIIDKVLNGDAAEEDSCKFALVVLMPNSEVTMVKNLSDLEVGVVFAELMIALASAEEGDDVVVGHA